MPLLRAGKHPLSFPAWTHTPRRKELSLPQTCQALVTGPSALTCWLPPWELGKQLYKRSFTKPLTFLLLKQLQKRTATVWAYFIHIDVHSYQHGADDSSVAETQGQGVLLRGQEPGSPSRPSGQESIFSLLNLETVFTKPGEDPCTDQPCRLLKIGA